MGRTRMSKTLANDVLVLLRADILNGRWDPGARLKMAELSTEFGVSLSVLREALNRLTEQGLVVLEPQAGFSVMSISAADLIDLTLARVHVEGVACRESVRLGDDQWEGQLLAAHHVLQKTGPVRPGSPLRINPEWVRAHNTFHDVLIAACGSRRLLAVASSLRDSAEVYRQWSAPLSLEVKRDVGGEHRAILDAALARDHDRAADLLVRHIQLTTDLVLDHLHADADVAG